MVLTANRKDLLYRAAERGRVAAREDGAIVLVPAHTDYRIRLRLAGDATAPPAAGARVKGTIEARALRMHSAQGGGRYIEPSEGAPRIVAGIVVVADEQKRRILVDAVVPMWLTAQEGQDFSVIVPGELVNCYVESGAEFRPTPTG